MRVRSQDSGAMRWGLWPSSSQRLVDDSSRRGEWSEGLFRGRVKSVVRRRESQVAKTKRVRLRTAKGERVGVRWIPPGRDEKKNSQSTSRQRATAAKTQHESPKRGVVD